MSFALLLIVHWLHIVAGIVWRRIGRHFGPPLHGFGRPRADSHGTSSTAVNSAVAVRTRGI